jgi:uncharacterized RDD family membrane protein YckC
MGPTPDPGASVAPSAPSLAAPPLARRMAAWLYEGVLLFGVLVAASLVFSVPSNYRGAIDDPRRFAYAAWLLLVLATYFTWFWSKGQTLAMKSWHLRIVDRNGAPLQRGRALLRFVLAWIWLLPPLAAMQSHRFAVAQLVVLTLGWVVFWALASRLHPQRQFWHDQVAGTRLIDSRPR